MSVDKGGFSFGSEGEGSVSSFWDAVQVSVIVDSSKSPNFSERDKVSSISLAEW